MGPQTSDRQAEHAHVEPVISVRTTRRLYFGIGVLTVALLVIDVTGLSDWEVSSTTLGLIGILIAIPIADQLKKLKWGDVEAEFGTRVENLERYVVDRGATTDEVEVAELAKLETTTTAAPVRGIVRRIVWVDDEPQNNRLEADELARRFDVIQVTATDAALAEVEKSPNETAVISDAVRVEGSEQNVYAGANLIDRLRDTFPHVPVYIFCGPGSVAQQESDLLERGARIVSASWTDIARAIRRDAALGLETAVGDVLREVASAVEHSVDGVDYVARVDGRHTAVLVRDWRRTPKPEHFDKAARQLQQLVQEGNATDGIIVTPRATVIPAQRERLPRGVRIASFDELRGTLARTPS